MPANDILPLGTRVEGKAGMYGQNIKGVVLAPSMWTADNEVRVGAQTVGDHRPGHDWAYNIEPRYLTIIPAAPRWV